jgi:hypothetical protein
MKKQRAGNSKLGAVERLLRETLRPARDEAESSHDLWLAMRRKLRVEAASAPPAKVRVPWFDWALAGGLALLLVAFPAAIPVLLYYL